MFLKFKESNIFYTKSGSGSAVVLLHGFLENSTMWEPFMEELAQKHTVVSIDLLGHGKSECIGYVHTTELMAEMVKTILTEEKIQSATFIGHSMGGYVSLAFAEEYPEMTDQLVLLNSTPQADSPERKENRDRAIQLVKKNKKGFLSMSITNLFAENNRELFKNEIAQLKKQAYAMPVQGIIATLEGMKIRKDRTLILTEFSKPKFIIAGKLDPIMPFEQQKQVAKLCGCSFIKLDGGHMSTVENRSEMLKFMHFID